MKTRVAIAALLLAIGYGCSSPTTLRRGDWPAENPALRDPAKDTAIKPVPRDPKWVQRHERFVARAKQGGVDVLFLGDSITDFWQSPNPQRGGLAVWKREFEPLHAVDFGISGDRTQHVLWRIENGELDGLQPKVVVLMIGTNNTGFEANKKTPRNTPAETAEGVRAIVRTLRAKLPNAKILLLAVFPREQRPDGSSRQQVDAINKRIRLLEDGAHVHFLDFGPNFLEPDGTLSAAIMPDFLHPSEKGYEIWAAAMKPTLQRLLRE